jgi:hypothetical protein
MATPPSLSDAVFTFNDEVVTYADVVLLAMVTGEWPAFAARCAMHAGIPPAFDQSAATSWREDFRRAHQLEAVADLDAWLGRRHLDREALFSFSTWQADATPGRVTAAAPRPSGGGGTRPQHLPANWWAEAVLSGDAERWISRLRAWLVATSLAPSSRAAGTDGPPRDEPSGPPTVWARAAIPDGPDEMETAAGAERAARVLHLQRSHRAWLDALNADPAIEQRIQQNRLAWTRLVFDECACASEAAARELALAVNDDGEELGTAALRAGRDVRRRDVLRQDLPQSLASILGGLPLRQASTPITNEDGFVVCVLVDRIAPEPSDSQVRTMARDEEAADRLEVAVAGRLVEVGAW